MASRSSSWMSTTPPRSEQRSHPCYRKSATKLDAVVHNAGVAAAGTLEDVSESELRRVMETNFFGVLGLTRTLLPTFRTQGRGRVVIVSSEAAFIGQPTNARQDADLNRISGRGWHPG